MVEIGNEIAERGTILLHVDSDPRQPSCSREPLSLGRRGAMPSFCTARADDLKHFFLGVWAPPPRLTAPLSLVRSGAFLLPTFWTRSFALNRDLKRDAAGASRKHTILDMLYLSNFVGEPHPNNRQHEAKRQPKGVNASASAMIVVILACEQGETQSPSLLGQRPSAGRTKSCLARSKQNHTAGLWGGGRPHAARLPRAWFTVQSSRLDALVRRQMTQ